jgi:hypothetical protein
MPRYKLSPASPPVVVWSAGWSGSVGSVVTASPFASQLEDFIDGEFGEP